MLINTFDQEPSIIWSGMVIPNLLYQKIFERINNLPKAHIIYKNFNPLNRIPFPDKMRRNRLKMKYIDFQDSRQFQLLECASLLTRRICLINYFAKSHFHLKNDCRHKVPSSKDPIELQKSFRHS